MKNFLLYSIMLIAPLWASVSADAQIIPLGTLVDFELFSSNSAISNTGNSYITGNVGSNLAASVTGFGNVNGRMHSADLTTAQAAADLTIAYAALNNAIPTYFIASPLGNNDTLSPGVYSLAGTSVLNANLVLDALGDTNAVFIFQLGAPFSTNTNSKVVLINGALACNVFWKVEGAVSMAAGTSMKGTIVVNNAALSMSVNDTLEGRALTTTGAITLNGVMAYTPTGCGSTKNMGPVPPVLGSAACFAMFTGNDAMTNTGVSYATGDIGTNVGLTTGFNPLNVTGTIHPIPDAATAAAASDLGIAYTYLNTLPHDIELLYPAQFGNDLVLTPHTYLLNAATSLTNSIYLNAEGNSNAIFVIKINGALSTSTYSNVILTNGTQAQNVYWKVDGAVSINDYSVFNGTIVCNNGAINLNTGVQINGRALTTNGAFSSQAVTVTSPSGPCAPMPVDWLYFRGHAATSTVALQWATASEIANQYFIVERSNDGNVFQAIGQVEAAKASGQAANVYNFVDQAPLQMGYYRITQLDLDGQRNYSSTVLITREMQGAFTASQYVDGSNIHVQVTNAKKGKATVELYNIVGQKIVVQDILITTEANNYQLSKPAHAGVYLLRIINEQGVLHNTKIMVQ